MKKEEMKVHLMLEILEFISEKKLEHKYQKLSEKDIIYALSTIISNRTAY